jgi:hypothetical protein
MVTLSVSLPVSLPVCTLLHKNALMSTNFKVVVGFQKSYTTLPFTHQGKKKLLPNRNILMQNVKHQTAEKYLTIEL